MGKLAESAPKTGRTYTCRLAEIMSLIDDADRAAVTVRLNDKSESNRAIAAWMSKNGPMSISDGTIGKHREVIACRQCRNG